MGCYWRTGTVYSLLFCLQAGKPQKYKWGHLISASPGRISVLRELFVTVTAPICFVMTNRTGTSPLPFSSLECPRIWLPPAHCSAGVQKTVPSHPMHCQVHHQGALSARGWRSCQTQTFLVYICCFFLSLRKKKKQNKRLSSVSCYSEKGGVFWSLFTFLVHLKMRAGSTFHSPVPFLPLDSLWPLSEVINIYYINNQWWLFISPD